MSQLSTAREIALLMAQKARATRRRNSIENATQICSPVSLSACGGALGDEERPLITRQPLLKSKTWTSVERVAAPLEGPASVYKIIDAACFKNLIGAAGSSGPSCEMAIETKQTARSKPPSAHSLRKNDRFGLDFAPVNLHRQTRTRRDMDHAIDDIQRVDEEMLMHRVPFHQVFLVRRVDG